MSRHRSARSTSRKHPLRRLFSFLVLTVVLIAVTFGFFWLLGGTFLPLAIDQNIVFVNSSLDGKEASLSLIHFSATEHAISIVPLNGDIEVEVLGGYGTYALAKVYPLLKIDKKDDAYVRAAMSLATGVIVDQVIETDDELTAIDQARLTKLLWLGVIQQGHSFFRISSLAKLYFFAKAVPPEQVSRQAEVVDLVKLKNDLNQIPHHECTLAVVNTTSTPKLASRLSTLFEQSGLLVVRVDDSPDTFEESTISYDPNDLDCQQAASRLMAVFPQQVKVVDQPDIRQEYRAELVIVIGKDLGELF